MLKDLLAQHNINLTKELSDIITADIKFNKIKFNKRTSLEELLEVAKRSNKVLIKCA